jgi:uncharacterized repeat protein (TIGR03803 family)
MKKHLFRVIDMRSFLLPVTTIRFWLASACLSGLWAAPAQAADRQILHNSMPAAVSKATPLRPSARWSRLNLSISLPLRDRPGLTNLLQQIYDPASPNFRHYLTPEQFAQRFGPTEEDYQAVVGFAKSHGLLVTATHANRTLVSLKGTVADVERTFHVTLNEYQHPTEARTFYAPDGEPSIDLATPVLGVSGLDNFVVPHPCLKPRLPGSGAHPQTGTAPGGAYFGNDLRAAYAPGVAQTGTGQIVGLLEFDSGFYQSDITSYENLTGLPNVPVIADLLDGYGGGPGDGNDEVSLDIEQAIAIAPGLSEIIVYEGSTTDDILSAMVDSNTVKQFSASWTYPIDSESDQLWMQMATQGQTYYNASGDSDAYVGEPDPPTDDPNITVVGGTTLSTATAGGAWSSETVWNYGGEDGGSSGGISTDILIPIWQQGISMTANGGSTTYRNLPDVAAIADDVYITFGNGEAEPVAGTSCAAPLWAAYTALMNQLAVASGEPTVGFINPAVYAIGKGSNALSYTTIFHDITTGNNESTSSPNKYVAVAGYDLCTGWGTPTGSNLITAIALPEPLRITPLGGVIFSGPVGGPFTPASQTYTLTNNGPGSINWSLANTSSVFMVSATSGTLVKGGVADLVTVSLAAGDTSLPAGSYTAALMFTNLSDKFGQMRQLTLDVVTPPAITSQPTNVAALDGQTVMFNVGAATNALLFYQWQKNGVNLTDAGTISGSASSNLTISGVVASNVGSYSVILSNAAGVLASSNAALTIVTSKPVIIQQPTNLTVLPYAPASFSVSVIGNTPYTYTWLFNGKNLSATAPYSGVTSNVLSLSYVAPSNAGTYSVVISNSIGSTTSTGAVLSLTPVTVSGLSMTTLWSFAGDPAGAFLYCPLVQDSAGNLYGTTIEGGADDDGTIFKITTNGVLTTLLSFIETDGELPYAGLFLGKDGYLYGNSYYGGVYDDGAVFRVTTGGSLSLLLSFNENNGEYPVSGMVQGSDGNFYGTANEGGAYGYGTLFRMSTTGSLTTLVAFDGDSGAYPSPVLAIGSDGNFYGTTEDGGDYEAGNVFKMTLSGEITQLYSFTGDLDGSVPIAGLVQAADGNFYGTTLYGGASGAGTVFEITSSGEFTSRYSFTGGTDGGYPWGGLVSSTDGNLYGTTQEFGAYGYGTVFQMAPNGTLATMAQFDGYAGSYPSAALVQDKDGNLYGTTLEGGVDQDGTIYRLNISGPLQITGQPADQMVDVGANALFTVATFGAAPVSYQWLQSVTNGANGAAISGATAATLTLSNVTLGQSEFYWVVVSNSFGSVTSSAAMLEVNYSAPGILTQPASQTVLAGTTVFFAVTADGNEPLVYQWQANGTNLTDGGMISGSSTSSLTISNVALTNTGTYSVIVSNALAAVPSANAVLTVLPAAAPGASNSTLHLFTGTSDGAFPYAGLVQGKNGLLYGMTEGGGSDYEGVIFNSTLSGGVAALYDFNGGSAGAYPYAGLALGTNGDLYGTTSAGGTDDDGTIFSLVPSPVSLKYLYDFEDGDDGAEPFCTLVQASNGKFYGTAEEGGSNGYGSVFQITASSNFTAIYGFTGGNDGGYPAAGVIQGSDGNLYGTTLELGAGDYGTVFKLTTNGTLTTLHSFSGGDGAYLLGGVIQGTDGNLYGCTYEGYIGAANAYGTVFQLTPNGTLNTLCSFDLTNGGNPSASLVEGTDGNFYGTTSAGGLGGQGTAFKITTNGTLTTLLSFDGFNGANPESPLIQASDGNFYGTTVEGGTGFNETAGGGGNGVIFRLTVPLFISNSITVASAIAALPYSASISNLAVSPQGDALTFSKVSGPAWLNVGANGALSGTPPNSAIGTNAFVASLTDTNGIVATAKILISVLADPPPTFLRNPFAEPSADISALYSANLATNATDVELSHGDTITFALVSGPAWLTVAANGMLSGTPQPANAGANTFVVSATSLGGASNTATMSIYVGYPPFFISNPFAEPAAAAGQPYAANIATNATDPNLGAVLAFSEVSGPSWLSVAGNGSLSGTPLSANVGTNVFIVTVADNLGLANNATLTINVVPAPPITLQLTPQGANLLLTWTGGIAPYQVQTATNLSPAVWQSLGSQSGVTNIVLTPSNVAAFYRILGN